MCVTCVFVGVRCPALCAFNVCVVNVMCAVHVCAFAEGMVCHMFVHGMCIVYGLCSAGIMCVLLVGIVFVLGSALCLHGAYAVCICASTHVNRTFAISYVHHN